MAFPFFDTKLTRYFYSDVMGARLGRHNNRALIYNFFGHQLVAHKVDKLPPRPKTIYPLHFGIIFESEKKWQELYQRLKNNHPEFIYKEKKIRFEDSNLDHLSFFLIDPTNNLLEFKYYKNKNSIFGEELKSEIGEVRE